MLGSSQKRAAAIMDGQENLPSKRAVPDPGGEPQPTQLDVLDDLEDTPEPVEVVDEGVLGEAGRNWCRPPAPVLNPAADKLGAWCRADSAWRRGV